MKRFVIERNTPGVGRPDREQMRAVAGKSNKILRDLGSDIQWDHSYVTQDKIYCVHLAKDEAIIRKRAELAGFPVNKVSEIKRVINPTTATVTDPVKAAAAYPHELSVGPLRRLNSPTR